MIELGEIAYQAYGESREWVNFQGGAMPRWEDLGEGIRHAWRKAAEAVELVVRKSDAHS